MSEWLNRNVLLLSFSAFFADLGYQAAIAIFPIFLVVMLKAPSYEYGLASAMAFGIGAFFGYVGGLAGDKVSNKWVAVAGNLLIPLISLVGLASSPITAIILFSGGWWARNFRSPPRRVMIVNSSSAEYRGKVFGFLHMLDIGGGFVSVVLLLALFTGGISLQKILLLTSIPLLISTTLLVISNDSKPKVAKIPASEKQIKKNSKINNSAYKGVILATALYGFSSYSLGFPILTIEQKAGSFLGMASYGVYLLVSAFTGYYIGSKKLNRIKSLGIIGYLLSGMGTIFIGVAYLLHFGYPALYLGVGILGFSLGVIETLEPTLISFMKSAKHVGKGMGSLTASRSIGIFSANLIMGLLYVVDPFYSYTYAGIVAIIAAAVVLYYGKEFIKHDEPF